MDLLIEGVNIILKNSRILFGLTLISVYIHYVKTYSYWKKRGINGPRPLPFVGNMISKMLSNNPHELALDWVRKYGKVYGYYEGTRPCLVVADAEIIREINTKNSDIVINRKSIPMANKYQASSLFALKDNDWKRVRAIMSPTFTSGKMKKLFKIFDSCAQYLVENFNEQLSKGSIKNEALVNLKDIYGLYALDTISTCCYGIKFDRSGAADLKTAATRNEFARIVMNILTTFVHWRLFLLLVLPEALATRLAPQNAVVERIKAVVESRRKSGKKFDDYLQMMLDTHLDNQLELDEYDNKENHHAGLSKESILEDQKNLVDSTTAANSGGAAAASKHGTQEIRLNDLEFYSNAIILLPVGYETTSNLLVNCTYALAFNPDVQQRLFEEVKKMAKFNEVTSSYEFDYESVTSCLYLDAVISETLRRFPTTIGFERQISRDYHIEKYNVTIEKGNLLSTAYYALSNDPAYWEEPEKFDPTRFMPENKGKIVPGAYCPFGLGPRHCIGMRFSLTESKLALAKMILRFRFAPAPGSSYPADYTGDFLPQMKEPFVRISPRDP